jgi:hypothetical protein
VAILAMSLLRNSRPADADSLVSAAFAVHGVDDGVQSGLTQRCGMLWYLRAYAALTQLPQASENSSSVYRIKLNQENVRRLVSAVFCACECLEICTQLCRASLTSNDTSTPDDALGHSEGFFSTLSATELANKFCHDLPVPFQFLSSLSPSVSGTYRLFEEVTHMLAKIGAICNATSNLTTSRTSTAPEHDEESIPALSQTPAGSTPPLTLMDLVSWALSFKDAASEFLTPFRNKSQDRGNYRIVNLAKKLDPSATWISKIAAVVLVEKTSNSTLSSASSQGTEFDIVQDVTAGKIKKGIEASFVYVTKVPSISLKSWYLRGCRLSGCHIDEDLLKFLSF